MSEFVFDITTFFTGVAFLIAVLRETACDATQELNQNEH